VFELLVRQCRDLKTGPSAPGGSDLSQSLDMWTGPSPCLLPQGTLLQPRSSHLDYLRINALDFRIHARCYSC